MDANPLFYGQDDQEIYDTFYNIRGTTPGLRMIDIPERTPRAVNLLVHEAAEILFSNPLAAAGTLRRAVEAMLDNLKVRKTKTTKKGKRVRMSTHGRVLLLEDKRRDVAKALLAVKWIGNSGSHEANSLTVVQVLDAADMFAYALRLAYDHTEPALKRKITQVNRSKRPISPRK